MIELRPMRTEDLPLVVGWLREPHVARWWPPESTVEAEVEKYRERLGETSPIRMLTVLERDAREPTPVGWCQWYPYDEDPEGAREVGALPGECGIDYAIGEPGAVGRGLGRELIPALVAEIRRHRPGCGVIVDPESDNSASRRVLERSGFAFVELRPTTGPGEAQMAIYRLTAGIPARPARS